MVVWMDKINYSSTDLESVNNRMGGFDKHNRLVGHRRIKLSSKRGYIEVFSHLLDSAGGQCLDSLQDSKIDEKCWKFADDRRYILA